MTTDHPMPLADIREANMSYLLLARRLLEEDRIAAMYRLGLTDSIANALCALTPTQTIRLASSPHLLWRLRLDDSALIAALAEDDGEEDASLSHMHAAIVLAKDADIG